VRRPDSSKQRLRLGTNQHPYGCARRRHAIAYTYGYSASKSESYTELTGIAYPVTIPDAYTYSERDHSSIAYTYGDGHSDSSAQGNTEASADSTSSAVTLSPRIGEPANRRMGE
jgi:hypothetical protein